MKNFAFVIAFILCAATGLKAQEVQTIFSKRDNPGKTSGYYGAVSNKFASINGRFANIVEAYGGWFMNKSFMLGIGGSFLTDEIKVPDVSALPGADLHYKYGQAGVVSEYVLGSEKPVHLVFHLFAGTGIIQPSSDEGDGQTEHVNGHETPQFFFVAEPGVQLELNVLTWMRVAPGITYRAAIGSNVPTLTDSDLSNLSYNITLKFGKF